MDKNIKYIKDKAGNNKLILYVDMDDVMCDFTRAVYLGKQIFPHIEYQQSRYGFFTNLEPIPGSLDMIKQIQEEGIYDVWFLTAPSINNLSCYSEKALWIQNHLGPNWLNKLIISPNKSLLIGDVLVDDSLGMGQEDFMGKHIHFGQNGVDWQKVKEILDNYSDYKIKL